MIKVHIQTMSEFCDGEAYTPIGPGVDYNGQPFIRHQPCAYCQGSGYRDKSVTLDTFIEMLTSIALVDLMEPNWLELAQEKVASQYQDSREAAGI
jgi:hypothetical protein